MISTGICFDRFELDIENGRLRDGDGEIDLPRLSRRLLCYLVTNRGRVVSFEEVRREVWDGVKVGEAAVHQALRQVRRALGDDARQQRFIKTVRSVGYRFVAPVHTGSARDARFMDACIGRPRLLEELARALDRALAGHGQTVLLSGDPGVGKTRTIEEVLRLAAQRGALVVREGGSAQAGAPPFWPWLPLFQTLSAHRPVRALREEIEALAPGLQAPGSQGSSYAGLSDVRRFRFLDAAARCLDRASRLGPLVIAIDDLHEVGGSALELLEYVSRGIGASSILILGAYRSEEALTSRERAQSLARTLQLPYVRGIALQPLDLDETAELALAHDPPLRSPAFLQMLARRTEGNPFFTIELTRFLRSTLGSADPTSVDWESRIPQGVQQILAARLASLSDDAQRVLTVCACLGGNLDASIVGRVEESIDVVTALEEARSIDFIRGDDPALRFSHPLIREAFLALLLRDPEAWRRLHLRISQAIERLRPESLQELAFHAAEAAPLGGVEQAVTHLRRAGEQAESSFDDDGAWEAYRRALLLLDRWPIEDAVMRCEILIAAGEVAVRGTRVDEARGLLLEATAIARRLRHSALFCRAALAFAYRDEIVGVSEGDVVELLEEALSSFAVSPSSIRAQLLSELARKIHYRPGALERALSLLDESVELARRAGDARSLARTLEDASFVRWSVPDPEGWIDLNREIVQAASTARDTGLLFRGLKGLGTGFMEIGDRDAMEREFDACAQLAAEAPAPYLRAVSTLHHGARAFLDGRFAEGEQCALDAMQGGLPAITPLAAVQLYLHRLETSRIAELEPSVRSLIEASPGIGAWRFALARLLTALGRFDEASEQLGLAGSVDECVRDRNWLAAAALCAESIAELGDARRAADLFRVIEPYARVNVALGHGALFYGNVTQYLGILETSMGRFSSAERFLESARAMHERMRSAPWQLRTRLALAENTAAIGEIGKAKEMAMHVSREASVLGMTRIAERARAVGA